MMPSRRQRHRNSNTEAIHVILMIPTHVTVSHHIEEYPNKDQRKNTRLG